MPLGIANAGSVVALVLGRRLPLFVVSVFCTVVAVATFLVTGGGSEFLGTQVWLMRLALVATWPDVKAGLRRL